VEFRYRRGCQLCFCTFARPSTETCRPYLSFELSIW